MKSPNIFPIGTILYFSGSSEDQLSNAWLPCDGAILAKDAYPELYYVIGELYKDPNIDKTNFRIPDYRGYFLRGADAQHAVGAIEDFATKLPEKGFTGDIPHLPNGNLGISGETRSNASKKKGNYDDETLRQGGDKESRPRNVYVEFYIRVK